MVDFQSHRSSSHPCASRDPAGSQLHVSRSQQSTPGSESHISAAGFQSDSTPEYASFSITPTSTASRVSTGSQFRVSQSQQSAPGSASSSHISAAGFQSYSTPGYGHGPFMSASGTPCLSAGLALSLVSTARAPSWPPLDPSPTHAALPPHSALPRHAVWSHAALPHAALPPHTASPHAALPHAAPPLHEHPSAQSHARLPLHAMRSVAGVTEGNGLSSFLGETPIGSVSARRDPSNTGTAARAVSIPCFACDKTDVGLPAAYRPSNPAWAAVAIICLGDHRLVRSCSSNARICMPAALSLPR